MATGHKSRESQYRSHYLRTHGIPEDDVRGLMEDMKRRKLVFDILQVIALLAIGFVVFLLLG